MYASSIFPKQMLAIKDGWALSLSMIKMNESLDPAWAESLQEALMHQLLGGDEKAPEWLPAVPITQEGNMVLFPLQSRVLDIAVPDGYGVDIRRDSTEGRSVFLYRLDGAQKYFHISSIPTPIITGEQTLTDLYTEEDLQELGDYMDAQMAEASGLKASSVLRPQGILNMPAIYTSTEGGFSENYYWIMDSNTVSVSLTSKDKPVSEDESAVLSHLVTVTDGDPF